MSKKLYVIGAVCDACGGPLYQIGKLIVKSLIRFRIAEYILAVCLVCRKLHTIERIWEKCQIFEDKEVQADPQTTI